MEYEKNKTGKKQINPEVLEEVKLKEVRMKKEKE